MHSQAALIPGRQPSSFQLAQLGQRAAAHTQQHLSAELCSSGAGEHQLILQDPQHDSSILISEGGCSLARVAVHSNRHCLSRQDSTESGASAFSSEHLASSWEAAMHMSTTRPTADSMAVTADVHHPPGHECCLRPRLDVGRPCQDLYASSGASAKTSLEHTVAQQAPELAQQPATSSSDDEDMLQLVASSSSLGSCAGIQLTASAHWLHHKPADSYPGRTAVTMQAEDLPSFDSWLQCLSDSEDEEELAQLEAKYGIHRS